MTRKILTEQDICGPEGRQIKALIALRGLRVEDVAATAGLGMKTLYRILAGTRSLSDEERGALLTAITRLGDSAASAADASTPQPAA